MVDSQRHLRGRLLLERSERAAPRKCRSCTERCKRLNAVYSSSLAGRGQFKRRTSSQMPICWQTLQMIGRLSFVEHSPLFALAHSKALSIRWVCKRRCFSSLAFCCSEIAISWCREENMNRIDFTDRPDLIGSHSYRSEVCAVISLCAFSRT